MKEIFQDVKSLGFDLGEITDHNVVVNGLPSDIAHSPPQEQLESLITQFEEERNELKLDNRECLARSMAKNMCIKAGARLNEEEIQSLIDELFGCSLPYTSPAGIPTMTNMSLDSIADKFNA